MANVIEIIIRAKDETTAAVNKAAAHVASMTKATTASAASNDLFSKSTANAVKEVTRFSPAVSGVVDQVGRLQKVFSAASDAPVKLNAQLAIVERLGISSGSGLLALQKSAQQANVGMGVLSLGLTSFRARILAAQSGAGPAAEALKKLGFSAEQITSGFGGAGQAFAAVIPRLLAVKDASQQAALASTLLGKGGTQLIPVLQGAGAAGGVAAGGLGAVLAVALPLAAAIAAVTAAFVVAKAAIDAAVDGARIASEFDILAKRAGVTAAEFSRLSFAAEQTGATSLQLGTALKTMSKHIDDARRGTGESARAFASLGISIDDLANKSPAETFRLIVDRLSQVGDQSARTALAIRIFGESADKLGPIFAGGGATLDAYGNRVEALGRVVGVRMATIARDFKQATGELSAAQEGLKLALAEALTPALTALTRAFTEIIVHIGGVVRAFNDMSRAAESVASTLSSIARTPLDNLSAWVARVAQDFGGALPVLREFAALLKIIKLSTPSSGGAGAAASAATGGGSLGFVGQPAGRDFRDVFTGNTNPDPSGATRRYKQQLEELKDAERDAAAEARRRASETEKAQKDAIEAQRKFSAALAESRLVSASLGESLRQALGPENAAGAIKGLQAALQNLEAPVGVTIGGKAALERLDQQIRDTEFAISVETDSESLSALKRKLDDLEAQQARIASGLRGLPTSLPNEITGAAAEKRKPVELVTELDATSAAIAQVVEQLEAAGVNGEHLRDVLAESGETAFLFAAGFESAFAAFAERLDPLRNFMADMSQAAFEVADGISNAIGGAFQNLVVDGHKFIDVLGGFAKALGKLAIDFVAQITAAIAKALILKAIMGSITGGFGFFLNAGGEVAGAARGGQVRRAAATAAVALALGGSIAPSHAAAPRAHLAAGGQIVGTSAQVPTFSPRVHLSEGGAIIHAAQGVRVIPGNAQAFDSVPAMLSPGEVVLPTIGGRAPGDLLAGLAQLGKDVSMLAARSFIPPGAQGGGGSPVTHYHVSTIDADGLRTFVRRGGIAREEALASDPARD